MTTVRDKNSASLFGGSWFVFEHESVKIAVHGSHISGMQRVYVNGEPVSEKRSLRQAAEHTFNVDGRQYRIEYKAKSQTRYDVTCALYEGDTLIKRWRGKSNISGAALFVSRLLWAGGGILACLALILYWDFWIVVVGLAMTCVGTYYLWGRPNFFEFEESNHDI